MSTDATSLEQKRLDEALCINKSVFEEDIDKTVYETKHYGNPYRLNESFSISYEDEKAVGVAAFLGMRLINKNESIPIYQCLDVSVLEAYQGRGHFSKVIKAFGDHDNGGRFIIGLPNHNSFPRFLKIEYTNPLWLCHFLYFTAPFSFVFGNKAIAKALDRFYGLFLFLKERKSSSEYDITLYEGMDEIPVTDEEIADIYSDSECHFLHDEKIYRWKQAYNPELKFYWAVLRKKDGTLLGYALCHLRSRMNGTFVIIDDHAAVGSPADKTNTMKILLSCLSKLGNITEIPFVNENVDGKLIRSLHFINGYKLPFKHLGSPLILSPDCGYADEMLNCSFRNIDSDVI